MTGTYNTFMLWIIDDQRVVLNTQGRREELWYFYMAETKPIHDLC